MQDQTKFTTTPDQAWSAMERILDREMPVNSRRRKRVLIWWTTIMGSGLILGGLMFWELSLNTASNSTIDTPATSINSQEDSAPVAADTIASQGKVNVDDKASLHPNQSIEQKPQSTTSTSNPISVSHVIKEESGDISNAPVSEKSHLALQKVEITSNTEITTIRIPLTTTSSALTSPISSEVLSAQTLSEIPANSQPFSVKSQQWMEPLPLLALATITAPNATANLGVEKFEPIAQKKFSKCNLHPFVAVSGLAGIQRGLGYGIAAGADLKLNNRLSLSTSLGYRSFSPNAAIRLSRHAHDYSNLPYQNDWLNSDLANVGIENYIEIKGLSSNFDNSAYTDLYTLVDDVRQLHLKAGLQWRFSPRFFATGGLQFAFMNRVHSQYPIVSGQPVSLEAYHASNPSRSLNSYDLANNTMTSWFGGIGMAIGTFTLHSEINWSLTPVFTGQNIRNRPDHIRGINLALAYYIR